MTMMTTPIEALSVRQTLRRQLCARDNIIRDPDDQLGDGKAKGTHYKHQSNV